MLRRRSLVGFFYLSIACLLKRPPPPRSPSASQTFTLKCKCKNIKETNTPRNSTTKKSSCEVSLFFCKRITTNRNKPKIKKCVCVLLTKKTLSFTLFLCYLFSVFSLPFLSTQTQRVGAINNTSHHTHTHTHTHKHTNERTNEQTNVQKKRKGFITTPPTKIKEKRR